MQGSKRQGKVQPKENLTKCNDLPAWMEQKQLSPILYSSNGRMARSTATEPYNKKGDQIICSEKFGALQIGQRILPRNLVKTKPLQSFSMAPSSTNLNVTSTRYFLPQLA